MTTLLRISPRVQPAPRRDLSWVTLAPPAPVLRFTVGKAPRPRAPRGGLTLAGRFYRGGSFLPVATEPAPLVVDRRCPACNDPVIGRADVVINQSLDAQGKLHACPHCKTAIVLSPEAGTLGERYFTRGLAPAPRDDADDEAEGPAWTWPAWTDAHTWELGQGVEPEDTRDQAVAFHPSRHDELYRLGYQLGLERENARISASAAANAAESDDLADLAAFHGGFLAGKAEWDARLEEMCGASEYSDFSSSITDRDMQPYGGTS